VDILPIVRVGADSTDKITVEELGTLFGGGLEGTQYVFVAANGTDVENAAELQAAYNLAVIKATPIVTPINISVNNVTDNGGGNYNITLTNSSDANYFSWGVTYNVIINGNPYQFMVQGVMGNTLIVTNLTPGLSFSSFTLVVTTYPRVTVIAAPGNYNFGTSVFTMNTEYIDLVSLDGNRSIIFNALYNSMGIEQGSISITANNVFVKGVDVQNKNFKIGGNNLNQLKIENCKGGSFSFGGDPTYGNNPIIVSGTFINCTGEDFSFGAFGSASGIFTNCVAKTGSFGSYNTGIASGIFTNCIGETTSFGGNTTASGTFTNCKAGGYSFGSFGIASGTFRNCIGDAFSFGGNGIVAGIYENCVGGDSSWISNQPGGKLTGKLYFSRHTFSQTNPSAGLGGSVVAFITGSNTFIS
jgi:hypothetical protein